MTFVPAQSAPRTGLGAAWPWILMLGLPGALFVLKYAPRAGVSGGAALAGYLAFFVVHCGVAYGLARLLGRPENSGNAEKEKRSKVLLFSGVLLYAAAMLAVYVRVDPAALNVDRWSALDNFWNALSQGDYPYRAPSHLGNNISGFPGLFLAALPFWLLGDVGLMQFVAWGGFAVLALRVTSRPAAAAFALLLLAGNPVFGYEVIVRSELFFNMLLVAVLLFLGARSGPSSNLFRGRRVLVAAAWGLLLSTRGVVIVPLVLAAFDLLRGRGARTALAYGAVLAATFLATLVPFYLWDPAFFRETNPYFVQAGYIPGWALAIVLLVTAWVGHRRGAGPSSPLFVPVALILFATVAGCFLLKVAQIGAARTLWGNGFDISYFALPLPFLLLHLGALAFPARKAVAAG